MRRVRCDVAHGLQCLNAVVIVSDYGIPIYLPTGIKSMAFEIMLSLQPFDTGLMFLLPWSGQMTRSGPERDTSVDLAH